jgi:hypothetical protein
MLTWTGNSKPTVNPRLRLALAWCRYRHAVGCWPQSPPLTFESPRLTEWGTPQVSRPNFLASTKIYGGTVAEGHTRA